MNDELTDKQQAGLLEKLAGKRGGQVVAAILNNFDAVEKSLTTMENSDGSAEHEMGIIQESLAYKINALKETTTGIWQNLFAREDIGAVIGALTTVLNMIDSLTEKHGLFKAVAAGASLAGIAAFKKNLD